MTIIFLAHTVWHYTAKENKNAHLNITKIKHVQILKEYGYKKT